MRLHLIRILNKIRAIKPLIKLTRLLAYLMPIMTLLIIGITSMAALYRFTI